MTSPLSSSLADQHEEIEETELNGIEKGEDRCQKKNEETKLKVKESWRRQTSV